MSHSPKSSTQKSVTFSMAPDFQHIPPLTDGNFLKLHKWIKQTKALS